MLTTHRAGRAAGRRPAARRRACVVVLVLSAALLCGVDARGGREPAKGELRVLFVGNSLTYSNDLPAILEALAEASKQKRLLYKSVAAPNFSLADHWNHGAAGRAIAEGGWDTVVMQQGPSASADGRKVLLEYARLFAREIRRVGARPALYMVWPSAQRRRDFDGVSESYKLAAEEVDGALFPAGEAWRAAWRLDPGLALYSPDGLHPTPAGSYLAALVLYEQLYGRSPAGLPAELKLRSGVEIKIPGGQAALLQKAAAEANGSFARRGK